VDTGGGPLARLWSTACGLVISATQGTAKVCRSNLPEDRAEGPVSFRVKIRSYGQIRSNATRADILPGLRRGVPLHFARRRSWVRAGRTKTWESSPCPMRRSAAASPRRARGVLSTTG